MAEESKFQMDFEKFRKAILEMDKEENAKYLDDCLKHLLDPSKSIKDIKCVGKSDLLMCIIGCDVSRENFMKNCKL